MQVTYFMLKFKEKKKLGRSKWRETQLRNYLKILKRFICLFNIQYHITFNDHDLLISTQYTINIFNGPITII